jgi:hypothetical protein
MVLSQIAVSTAVGKHPQGDPHEDDAPDPTAVTEDASDAKKQAQGVKASHKHDKTKKPVSEAVWSQARPVMHALADVSALPSLEGV